MKTGMRRSVPRGCSRPVIWSLTVLFTVLLLSGIYSPEDTPCREPVTYRIGSIDERFGVDAGEVAEAADMAASVWEEASGMDLFREDDGGAVEISLVYDYRQATSDRLKGISGKIENTRSSYDSLKLWFTTREAEFSQRQDLLRHDIEMYNGQIRDLNARYEAASRSGSVSQDVERHLTELREDLDIQRESLRERQDELNGEAQALNDLVTLINQIAQSLNLEVVNYNRAGKPLQEEFREGCYEKKSGRQRITIYHFSDRSHLVRLLAHELGHALGLDHNDNPDALMYRMNRSKSLILAQEDRESLQTLCGKK
jgi:hypothetical protein